MVVAKIMQGLGNQMFQYAAARALSLHLKEELKLNIENYGPNSLRKYELAEFFEINPSIVTKDEMKNFNLTHPVRRVWNKIFTNKKIKSLPYEEKNKLVKLLYKTVYLFRPPHKQLVYEEKQFEYDSNFFKTQKPVFLKGYWMSYKYFDNYQEVIFKDFTIRNSLVKHLSEVAHEIRSSNSIAMHIRCGDKLLPQYVELMGILSSSYYQDGIDYIINKKNEKIKLYAFTDSIENAKLYIPNNLDVTWVSQNITKSPIEDFYLMTQCQNIIISNSSFSWWAAYLNKSKDRIVVIPKKWYNNNQYNGKDLYCEGWVKK